jgi:cytochrome P450
MTRTDGALVDDLLAPEVNADPYPYFAALREADPVHWSERHQAWIVTRHDDVTQILMDWKHFSSERVGPLLEAMDRSTSSPEQVAVMEMLNGWMVVTDPPVHKRLRMLAAKAFNPRRVAAKEGRIQELVDELLDEFIASGSDRLVADFAFPLPATVIAELIGAPPKDTPRFKDWSDDLAQVAFGAGGDERNDRYVRAMRGIEELFAYFEDRMEYVRQNPGEDMISDLLVGDGKGDRLSDEEIKSMCALMLFAGHETTTTTITSAVLMLLRNPDQLEMLRADPDEVAGPAVEEALRFDGAIKVLIRYVAEDFELRGREIKAGQRVFVLPAAANRDPERFEDPDSVDVTRNPNPHVAFGKGIHACIGAQLSRIEMRVALASIVRRMPDLRFAEEEPKLRYAPSLASRALQELRIAYDRPDA